MAYREVSVTEVREVLRLWVRGESLRSITRLVSPERKTVRRYVEAAQAAGLTREAGEEALTDELLGAVVEAVRPFRPRGHGEGWERCEAERDRITGWLDADVPVVKIGDLLERRGITVAERTLHRFCADELGHRRHKSTVRVDDGEPGQELQVDFGRVGFLVDAVTGRRRVVRALIFTAVFSRHLFVWLCHRETLEDVIAGCEAAWAFFGGVFAVMIPDNLSPVVAKADGVSPRFTDAFVEYAQSRGFVIDPARVRSPQDKPRVERAVPYVRGSSSPASASSISPMRSSVPSAGVWARPDCASTAAPSSDPWRCSAPSRRRCCCPPRPSRMTCRSTDRRRCIGIITSRSPGRCTRCPAR